MRDAGIELADTSILDEHRQYDGVIHCDMTYNPCDEYYTESFTMYNYQLRKTIPILFTFLKRATGHAFSKHFEAWRV